MMKLSYILPIYNVEKYISACLDSIFEQDIPCEEYEVICVDDCSPDNSIKVVESYKNRHPNINIVRHDVNKKAGGARNTGISVAKGEYIWFVDPDDMISPNITSILINRCNNQNLDVLCFNITKKCGDDLMDEIVYSEDLVMDSGINFLTTIFGNNIIYHMGYPWRCLYRRSLLNSHSIQFPEGVLFGEDTTFMTEAITQANRVGSTSICAYVYRQNDSSASAQLFEQMKGELIYQSCIVAGEMVMNLSRSLCDRSPELSMNIENGLPWFVNRIFIRLIKTNYIERRNFYKILKQRNTKDDAIFNYMDARNRFIILFPMLSLVVLDILSVIYSIKHAK